MKKQLTSTLRPAHALLRSGFTLLAAALLSLAVTVTVPAQDAAATLPPGVQDVVKLAHAGISDDIILAQIKNNGNTYNLTVDQILYLNSQGVSQSVIKALMPVAGAAPTAAPAPAPAPVAPTAPVAPPTPDPSAPGVAMPGTPAPAVDPASAATLAGFQSQLASYGTWLNVPGYGLCWQPSVSVANPFWRPYFDAGHWTYSDTGWYWQSDYPWGDIVFHYGRWHRYNAGWVWIPGYDWAPAWVCWRQTDDYCGWAPLPPEAVFVPGVGLTYGGQPAADIDFGLDYDSFVFIGYDHFWDFDLHAYLVPRDRRFVIFRDSHVLNGYRFDHGHFFVEGIGHDRIGLLTHHDVHIVVTPHGVFDVHGGGYNHGGPGGFHDYHDHDHHW